VRVVARDEELRAEVRKKITDAGGFVKSYSCDITEYAANDKLAKELASLGAGFTPPRSMRNDVDLRSYTKRNGQNAYDRWQELTGKVRLGGKTLREQLERMIENPEYQRLDPTSVEGYESPRVGMIRSMVSRYRDAAFRETMREYPDLMEAERGRRATVVGASSGKPFSELLQYSRER
jgi:hypothetical protein